MNVRDVVLEALSESGLSFRVKDGIVIVVDPEDSSVRWDFTVPLRTGEVIRPCDSITDRAGVRYVWSEAGQKYVEAA